MVTCVVFDNLAFRSAVVMTSMMKHRVLLRHFLPPSPVFYSVPNRATCQSNGRVQAVYLVMHHNLMKEVTPGHNKWCTKPLSRSR